MSIEHYLIPDDLPEPDETECYRICTVDGLYYAQEEMARDEWEWIYKDNINAYIDSLKEFYCIEVLLELKINLKNQIK